MNFTFGIITNKGTEKRINTIIDSIETQKIPEYEVLIVGSAKIEREHTRVIPFDESKKRAWITKKKNMLTQEASFENVVYLHDYIKFEEGWYDGFLQFGNDFKVCMNVIQNKDGYRYRDWSLWAEDSPKIGFKKGECILPYWVRHLTKYMYISGAYWVAKKDVMEEFPLDEKLTWGAGEDVEWSKRIREKYDFSMNDKSKVKLMKQKAVILRAISDKRYNEVMNIERDGEKET